MRAQISIEFLMLVIIFLIIFSYISIPMRASAEDHLDDLFTASQAKSIVTALSAYSQSVSIGGSGSKRTLEAYSPCAPLACASNLLSCSILLTRPVNNPFSEQDEAQQIQGRLAEAVLINGNDCNQSTAVNISTGKGWVKLVVEK